MGSRTGLSSEVLQAAARGQIRFEDLLRFSLRHCPAAGPWLSQELRAAQRREVRPLRLPGHHLEAPLLDEVLRQARRRLGRRRGLAGLSWGVKYRGGLPGERCALIAWVEHKDRRLAASRRLPERFEVELAGRRLSFPVDVEEVPRCRHHLGGTARAGDRVRVVVGNRTGTLSALLENGQALISGHVACDAGVPVTAQLVGRDPLVLGRVAQVRRDATVDGARIDGVPPEQAGLAGPPRPLAELDASQHDVAVTALLIDGDRTTAVNALGAPAYFEEEDVLMTGLIRLASQVTEKGDSGAPVVDQAGRLIGFVLGASNGFTMVIPAGRVIDGTSGG
jgi:hypothetical protein